MFETWAGEDRFRAGMREYLASHAFGSGNSNDLVVSLTKASGKGEAFSASMKSFLDQPGIPLVHTEVACKDGKASLDLAQSRYLPFGVLGEGAPKWGVPVCTRFGRGDASSTECFLLDSAEQRFDLAGGCPDWYLPNAQARGYYRFDMAPADLARLGNAIPHLSAPEQVIYADTLTGAFQRGELGPAAVLDAMPALAKSDMPQVATALLDTFEWIREQLANDRVRGVLDAYATSIYADRMSALGYHRRAGDTSTTIALRQRIAHFLALIVRDPGVRKELVAQGRAALGLDGSGKVDLSRADPDLLRTILRVTVQDAGAPAFDAVTKEFASNRDTNQRYSLLAGLGATRDPALAEKARDFGLDPSVQVGELANIYESNVDEPENRAAAWQWLQAHYAAYRERMPAFRVGYMPKMFADGRCSGAEADELSAFFAPRVKELVGGDRGLSQTLEAIRQCASLREHEGPKALDAWLETRETHGAASKAGSH